MSERRDAYRLVMWKGDPSASEERMGERWEDKREASVRGFHNE